MRTLTSKEKAYFQEQAKLQAPRHKVCIGKGSPQGVVLEDYFDILFSTGGRVATTDDKMMTSNWGGSCPHTMYYTSKAEWEKRMGIKIAQAPIVYTIPEQIKYAQNFVGKQVKVDGQRVKVGEILFLKDTDDLVQDAYVAKANKIIKSQGIVLAFADSTDGVSFIHPTAFPLKVAPKVVVNGKEAVDKGTHYEFGCAEITKAQLLVAKNFLEGANKGIAKKNRTIDGVKIGAGTFTLKELNELV